MKARYAILTMFAAMALHGTFANAQSEVGPRQLAKHTGQ